MHFFYFDAIGPIGDKADANNADHDQNQLLCRRDPPFAGTSTAGKSRFICNTDKIRFSRF